METEDNDDIQKIIQYLKSFEDLNDFEWYIPKNRNPQKIIKKVPLDLSEDDVMASMVDKNPPLTGDNFKVDFVIKNKNFNHFVISVDPTIFKTLHDKGSLYVGWSRLETRTFYSYRHCSGCGRLGLSKGQCTFSPIIWDVDPLKVMIPAIATYAVLIASKVMNVQEPVTILIIMPCSMAAPC